MIVFPGLNLILFSLIALLHIYWAFGGKWGIEHVVPKIEGKAAFEPGPIATLVVAAGLFGFAAVQARVMGCCSIGADYYIRIALVIIAAIFLLRAIGDFKHVGFFKKNKDSSFAKYDSLFFSPLCLLIFVNSLMTYWML